MQLSRLTVTWLLLHFWLVLKKGLAEYLAVASRSVFSSSSSVASVKELRWREPTNPRKKWKKNETKKKKKKKITLGEIIVFITAIGEMIVNENKKRKAGNQNEISNKLEGIPCVISAMNERNAQKSMQIA